MNNTKGLFDAIVFAVHDCGFVAWCALEASDSGEARIDKILAIIAKCKFGIHDISRTELRQKYEAPTLQHASRARTLSRSQNVRSKRTTSKSVLDPRSPEISLPKILLRYRPGRLLQPTTLNRR